MGALPNPPAGMRAYTALELQRAIDSAKKHGVAAVVLDIDGPGGLVTEMQAMVDVLFKAQREDEVRIVALPRDAFSAWAIVCLACKEIVATPTSRLGAAVSIQRTSNGFVEALEGQDAVSQKMLAPWKSRMRAVNAFTGRCDCIAEAMTDQDKQLWWSPKGGFSDQGRRGPDWKCLDDSVGVCCLNESELLETGIAIAVAKTSLELPKSLGLDGAELIEIPVESNRKSEANIEPKKPSTALRSAAAQIRETCDLLNSRRLFVRGTTTYRTTQKTPDSGVVGGQRVESVSASRDETDGEMCERIQTTLRLAKSKLPQSSTIKESVTFTEGIEETRLLLDEAIRHARNRALTASQERTARALKILRALANSY